MHVVLRFVMPGVLALTSLAFAGIGLKGILGRRPFAFPARLLSMILIFCLTPAFSLPLLIRFFGYASPGRAGAPVIFYALNPALFVFVAVMFFYQMRGYFVLGVTDESFREALHFALGALGLPFEERLSLIHLPSESADLQIMLQASTGTAQIKPKDRHSASLAAKLPEIARQIEAYYIAHPGRTNMTSCWIYLGLGAFMLVIAGALATIRLGRG